MIHIYLFCLCFSECQCDKCGTASCDDRTGVCHCRPGVTGRLCDQCEVRVCPTCLQNNHFELLNVFLHLSCSLKTIFVRLLIVRTIINCELIAIQPVYYLIK